MSEGLLAFLAIAVVSFCVWFAWSQDSEFHSKVARCHAIQGVLVRADGRSACLDRRAIRFIFDEPQEGK